jgi:hypothetical protein
MLGKPLNPPLGFPDPTLRGVLIHLQVAGSRSSTGKAA